MGREGERRGGCGCVKGEGRGTGTGEGGGVLGAWDGCSCLRKEMKESYFKETKKECPYFEKVKCPYFGSNCGGSP